MSLNEDFDLTGCWIYVMVVFDERLSIDFFVVVVPSVVIDWFFGRRFDHLNQPLLRYSMIDYYCVVGQIHTITRAITRSCDGWVDESCGGGNRKIPFHNQPSKMWIVLSQTQVSLSFDVIGFKLARQGLLVAMRDFRACCSSISFFFCTNNQGNSAFQRRNGHWYAQFLERTTQ